jgi:hypothetical protein
MMAERTQQEINASILNDVRDCLGPRDPEANRKIALKMGASQEEADQVAQFWQEHNRQWEEAQRKAS